MFLNLFHYLRPKENEFCAIIYILHHSALFGFAFIEIRLVKLPKTIFV